MTIALQHPNTTKSRNLATLAAAIVIAIIATAGVVLAVRDAGRSTPSSSTATVGAAHDTAPVRAWVTDMADTGTIVVGLGPSSLAVSAAPEGSDSVAQWAATEQLSGLSPASVGPVSD